jgi:hypothetical protein
MPPASSRSLMSDDEPTPSESPTPNLEQQVRELQQALEAMRATVPTTLIPEHGAGPGMQINPTWSQAEQEVARAG